MTLLITRDPLLDKYSIAMLVLLLFRLFTRIDGTLSGWIRSDFFCVLFLLSALVSRVFTGISHLSEIFVSLSFATLIIKHFTVLNMSSNGSAILLIDLFSLTGFLFSFYRSEICIEYIYALYLMFRSVSLGRSFSYNNDDLDLLRQMDAHFIYNVLITIEDICDEDTKKSKSLINKLSLFLKDEIYSYDPNKNLVSFRSEIDHIEPYIRLRESIEERKIEVKYDLAFEDFDLPPFVLQPVVENAIDHSLYDAAYRISISSGRSNGFNTVTVQNTNDLNHIKKDHLGISMNNAVERLKKSCNGKLSIVSEDGMTKTIIMIPERKFLWRS